MAEIHYISKCPFAGLETYVAQRPVEGSEDLLESESLGAEDIDTLITFGDAELLDFAKYNERIQAKILDDSLTYLEVRAEMQAEEYGSIIFLGDDTLLCYKRDGAYFHQVENAFGTDWPGQLEDILQEIHRDSGDENLLPLLIVADASIKEIVDPLVTQYLEST